MVRAETTHRGPCNNKEAESAFFHRSSLKLSMNCGAQLKKETHSHTESRTTDCAATTISGGEEKPFIILEVLQYFLENRERSVFFV